MATTISTIEDRQKFIEDSEERKAKIRQMFQDLTPEEAEELRIHEDFTAENYDGDNANDFFWKFVGINDGFIYRHIDDLIACGAKVEDINKMISEYPLHDTPDFLWHFDTIADHVGHGIDFNAFARTYGVDPERSGENTFVDLFQAAYEDFFNELAFCSSFPHQSHLANGPGKSGRKFTEVLLANGASAKQLLASDSCVGYSETLHYLLDLLLENDANANDIVSRLDEDSWETEELDFFVKNLDTLLEHGLDINRVQNLGDRVVSLCSESERTEYAKILEAHGIKF